MEIKNNPDLIKAIQTVVDSHTINRNEVVKTSAAMVLQKALKQPSQGFDARPYVVAYDWDSLHTACVSLVKELHLTGSVNVSATNFYAVESGSQAGMDIRNKALATLNQRLDTNLNDFVKYQRSRGELPKYVHQLGYDSAISVVLEANSTFPKVHLARLEVALTLYAKQLEIHAGKGQPGLDTALGVVMSEMSEIPKDHLKAALNMYFRISTQ